MVYCQQYLEFEEEKGQVRNYVIYFVLNFIYLLDEECYRDKFIYLKFLICRKNK